MAKLIDKMEEAILKGDWEQLCIIYNKMTGKNISPPKPNNEPPPFDYMKAKKSELVKKLKELGISHGNLTLSELREVYELNLAEDQELSTDTDQDDYHEEDVGAINASPNPSFTYIPPSKASKMLNDDKETMSVRLRDFPTYNDEREHKHRSTRSNKLVTAKCRECKQVDQIHPSKLIAGTTNDKIYICPKCV